MKTRRIMLTVGAAAGGLLAAAFLSTAVAFADPTLDPFGFEPSGGEFDQSAQLGVPPIYAQDLGYQVFDVCSTAACTTPAGSFEGLVSTLTTSFGFSNEEVEDTDVTPITGTPGVDGVPAFGSVFDIASFDNGAITNDYSDIVSPGLAGTQTVTDTLNLFGTAIDLTPLFSGFDASPIDIVSLF
jgi:hypothetical protein